MPKKDGNISVGDLVTITSRLRPHHGSPGVIVSKLVLPETITGPKPPGIKDAFWFTGFDVAVIRNPEAKDPKHFKFFATGMYQIGEVEKKVATQP